MARSMASLRRARTSPNIAPNARRAPATPRSPRHATAPDREPRSGDDVRGGGQGRSVDRGHGREHGPRRPSAARPSVGATLSGALQPADRGSGRGVPSPYSPTRKAPSKGRPDGTDRPRRARPGQLDRRQGIDDPEARGTGARGGQAGRPVHPLPGALLRAVLLPGPGRPVLQLHRAHPGRPDHEADAGPRQGRPGMVVVAPMYEEDEKASGIYYNTAAVIDVGRHVPRQVPQDPHPARQGLLGEVLLPARQPRAIPVFETAVGKVGVYICYDRHFPEGARALGLNGAEIVLIPSATSRGLSEYLWRIEQVSHAVANGYYVGTINRVGIEKDIRRRRLLRPELLRRPARPVRRRRRAPPMTRSSSSATSTWSGSPRSATPGSSTATAGRTRTPT